MEDILLKIQDSLKIVHQLFSDVLHTSKEFQQFLRIQTLYNDFTPSHIVRTGNQFMGKISLEFILNFLKQIEESLLKYNKKKDKIYQEQLNDLLLKVNMLVENIHHSFNLSVDDLACLTDDHERKIALKNITKTIKVEDSAKLNAQLQKFLTQYNLMKAVLYKIYKYKPSSSRNLLTGWLMMNYSIFAKGKVKRLASKFDSVSNIESLKKIWDLADSKLLRLLIPITLPSISFNKLIYIPRLVTFSIEPSSIKKANEEKNAHYIDLLSDKDTNFALQQDLINSRVQVRVLSNKVIHSIDPNSKNCCSSSKEYEVIDKIIIHVHGGAFLAMSTFSHQSYTRVWANRLNVPIFSIDYRLAPEDPFPAGLDDIWQAYTWIVNYSSKFLGINPKKIILAGDSAGGNLITAVTLKAISEGFRIPDGLLLIYPAMNMQIKYFSKSLFLSFDDVFLTPRAFPLIRDYYATSEDLFENYLVSPVFAPQEMIEKFPKTEMMITLSDPLSHDAIRFAEKLLQASVDTHIFEYPDGIHGMLSLGTKHIVPLYSQSVDDSCELLSRLLI